jgi:molecular chaperone DnaK
MTVVGIDLGTSNTVVAHMAGGRARTFADATSGRTLIPSVISFHPSGNVLVGDVARERRFVDPTNTIFGAKRLMGRTWASPELQEARKRLPYELRQGKNQQVRAMLRGELYTMPELSAFVLRKAKAVAEEALKTKVTEAVITVPANFNDLQREATKLAGTLAGLDVLRVLNEPTAAALAYGQRYQKTHSEQIAVYDFGGGTFDLTLLTLSKTVLRVRATSGDMFLGGDDIDMTIANHIAETFLRKHYYDPRADPQVFDHLRVAAEEIKTKLSKDDVAEIELNDLMIGQGGRAINFRYTLTRSAFDAMVVPYVDRTLKVCRDALTLVRAEPKNFDRVVLVGGSTHIPLVRQRVSEFFGREPAAGVSPEEAVAIGAAVQGRMIADQRERQRRENAAAPEIELVDDDLVLDPPLADGEEIPISKSFPPPPIEAAIETPVEAPIDAPVAGPITKVNAPPVARAPFTAARVEATRPAEQPRSWRGVAIAFVIAIVLVAILLFAWRVFFRHA